MTMRFAALITRPGTDMLFTIVEVIEGVATWFPVPGRRNRARGDWLEWLRVNNVQVYSVHENKIVSLDAFWGQIRGYEYKSTFSPCIDAFIAGADYHAAYPETTQEETLVEACRLYNH